MPHFGMTINYLFILEKVISRFHNLSAEYTKTWFTFIFKLSMTLPFCGFRSASAIMSNIILMRQILTDIRKNVILTSIHTQYNQMLLLVVTSYFLERSFFSKTMDTIVAITCPGVRNIKPDFKPPPSSSICFTSFSDYLFFFCLFFKPARTRRPRTLRSSFCLVNTSSPSQLHRSGSDLTPGRVTL